MPILSKKIAAKPDGDLDLLKDDDEVFHCEVTDEIFRNYEEYCERVILVNSMVWSCSLTGRANLTYAEALKSEQDAGKALKKFPAELRVPLIYLASQTKRKNLKDMLEDVFQYAKDIFFIGEKVQVYLNEDWIDAQITLVKESPKKTKDSPKHDPLSYSYDLKLLPAHPNSKTLTFKSNQIQRKKSSYTRPRNKLFLKQYVEQGDGVFRIKDSIIKKFKIDTLKFSDIFVGEKPDFAVKPKPNEVGNAKAQKQESIAKYFTKADEQKLNHNKINAKTMNGDVKSLKNKPFAVKKSSEEYKQKILNDKKTLKEKKHMEKMNVKDMEARLQKFIRLWHLSKEDLELTDQKILPTPNVVDTFITNKKFGEFIAILEFLETFSEELDVRESFPHGVTWEILERALTLKEINGPLHDIFQLLLLYIFNVLTSEYGANQKASRAPPIKCPLPEEGTLAAHVEHATSAFRFANSQFGSVLVNKQVDAVTLSEVLRLHLLSSGSRTRENLAKYRSNQRGGYDSTDDPGLQLRISHPHILKALSMYNICQLPQSDILQLLKCLMDQIITYTPIRELVEKRLEASAKAKFDLRTLHAAHRKTIAEYTTNKQKCTKDLETEQSRENQKALDTLEKEHTTYLQTYTEQCNELLRIQFSHEIFLGSDRCHRRYWLFESVPGLFVEDNEISPGSCLQNIIQQHPALSTCEPSEYVNHLKEIFKEQHKVHDKENTDVSVVKNSSIVDKNALHTNAVELMMCTADENACKIHGSGDKNHWYFFHTKEEIDSLIGSLNKRGVRERLLLNNLKQWKEMIYEHIESCPVDKLNKNMQSTMSLRPKMKYHENDTNLNHAPGTDPSVILQDTLVEFILELYEKIASGCLGKLQVDDVDKWSEALRSGSYDMQCDELTWGIQNNKTMFVKKKTGEIVNVNINANVKEEEKEKDDETKEDASDDDDDLENILETAGDQYYDPGNCLGATIDIESEDSEEEEIFALHESSKQKEQLHNLACALLQVAQSVEPMNMQSPFGAHHIKTGQYSEAAFQKSRARYRKWEISLMNSTSYAQIFNHHHAFEQSVIWSNSIQYASCRVCKRKSHPEQMLLCDKCNCAIHMYCVKPSLKEIPEGDWYCDTCNPPTEKEKKGNNRKRRNNRMIKSQNSATKNEEETSNKRKRRQYYYESMTNGDDSGLEDSQEMSNGVHEEKPKNKSSRRTSSIDTFTVCNACKSGGLMITCDTCQLSWHVECVVPAIRRAPRGKWCCTKCSKNSRKHDTNTESSDESAPVRKTRRTNETILENSFSIPNGQEFDTFLGEIGKHRDSWPFMSPVTLEEVPDYFEVIKEPMDFGTIKNKLKNGEYKRESDVINDIALVFENCDTYNNGESDVFKAGARLLKFVLKRGQELNIEFPESIRDGFVE